MNAREELLRKLEDMYPVMCGDTKHGPCFMDFMDFIKCANIEYDPYNEDDAKVLITLRVGYTAEEYEAFLEKLNFYYDSGYGTQELEGTVWLKDGTWLSRREYDGSEWWHHNRRPSIPHYLQIRGLAIE